MSLSERMYETGLRLARPLARIAAPAHPKLGRAVAGREGLAARFDAWAKHARDASRPLVWLHAPSVGEALMAQAILGSLRERRPGLQAVFTHFSPSAERMADRVGADLHDYLPWDITRDVRGALDALRPTIVAFVRTEVWPVLTREAKARGVRLALVNGVLSPDSGRLRSIPRRVLAAAYARLDAVGAVAEPDAARFERLGVSPDRVRVTGDARFDQVARRLETAADAAKAWVDRLGDPAALTIVAGSTWPADEERLVPALAGLRRSETETTTVRAIIAPHEPGERHLAGLERRLSAAGLDHVRLGRLEAGGSTPEVIIVDRVGILAELYAVGDVAYVGGGFHDAGLHAVAEPAALGMPVLFGPRHGNAREAAELAGAGGGFEVRDRAALAARLEALAMDEVARRSAGSAAADYVRSRRGGAARNAALLDELIAAAPSTASSTAPSTGSMDTEPADG